ncbi:uncharacterized protein [Rutidosis leptorrhynchoides]|uniref:uncharacterized protein n=1 Tax=Rutidosis leptorrhynchoides TaxID=125765 RepID=UPI003A99E3DE
MNATIISSSYDHGNETDHPALLSFKSLITHDPYGALNSWNTSFHLCDWIGVICGMRHKRVTALLLDSQDLDGLLSPHVGNLSFLRVLRLGNNSFQKTVPHELGRLFRLRFIDLEINKFNGFIPTNLSGCWNLETLVLGSNELVGSIPKEIGLLSKLTVFVMQENRLTGGIPPFLGNITSLEMLSLAGNPLGGSIPGNNLLGSVETDEMKFIDSLNNCSKLESLSLYNCNFKGALPMSIGNLSDQLSYLDLSGNKLLENLSLSIGQILDAIGNLSGINILFLSYNKLEGVIPSSLGNCHHIEALYLNNNRLSDNIPKQLLQLSSLTIALDLSQNNLFGSLPLEVDLKMLTYLGLSHNNLLGNIPSSLGGCTSLSYLYINNNLFQGMLPPSLSSMRGLVELGLSHNNLSGEIPRFLEGFSSLEALNLSFNDFEGEVPVKEVFAKSSGISIVGNRKLCGGLVELGLSKCKEKKKHKKRFPVFVIALLIASSLLVVSCVVKGAFSSIYKGLLEHEDRFVAVKVLHLQTRGAHKNFLRECEAWRSVRHRNLLKIITSCSSVDFQGNDFKALVYEFMPNGSLHDWIHSSVHASRLNLLQRINILIDIASALDYLHNFCVQTIAHCDLKSSNILLDEDMVAHVGDFGLAQFLGTNSDLDKYGLGSKMTSSGDVYSFGKLLLEVMTGKYPTHDIFSDGLSLHKFVSTALVDQAITDLIDSNAITFQSSESNAKKVEECLASTLKIGVSCSADSSTQRMLIENVVHELHHIKDVLQNIRGTLSSLCKTMFLIFCITSLTMQH